MIGRLDHVALAVPDLRGAIARHRALLGAEAGLVHDLPAHGVRAAFLDFPGARLELLEPLGEGSPLAGFLRRHPGGGLHHVCYEVPDLRAARDRLLAGGARLAGDGEPRPGAHGRPVLFLHPAELGALVELLEA